MFMLVTIRAAGKCHVTGCIRHPPCHTCSACCQQLVQVHPISQACRLASTCATNAAAHTTLLCLCGHPLRAHAH